MKVEFNSNCFDDELLHLFLEKPLSVSAARLGPFGNYSAHTLVHLKPAFMDKVLNGLMRGVRVDFESGCQGANGRESLPWLELAANKCFLGGENYLIHNRFTGLELKAESCHMHNVTAMTGESQVEDGFHPEQLLWDVNQRIAESLICGRSGSPLRECDLRDPLLFARFPQPINAGALSTCAE